MRALDISNREIDYDKLLLHGFSNHNGHYIFEKNICNNSLKVVIEISNDKSTSKVIDLSTNDEYILVDVPNAVGSFVGAVKDEYDKVINDFLDKCTTSNIFKSTNAKKVISYVKETYNDDLEYLWDKLPDCAIWRNKDNQKWYGLMMKIKGSSLGLDSDLPVDILNLKYQKDKVNEVIDNKSIFPGYHCAGPAAAG